LMIFIECLLPGLETIIQDTLRVEQYVDLLALTQRALKLALDYNITAYDAYFLQCANHLSIPLITLDKRMKKVAYDLNIEVME